MSWGKTILTINKCVCVFSEYIRKRESCGRQSFFEVSDGLLFIVFLSQERGSGRLKLLKKIKFGLTLPQYKKVCT